MHLPSPLLCLLVTCWAAAESGHVWSKEKPEFFYFSDFLSTFDDTHWVDLPHGNCSIDLLGPRRCVYEPFPPAETSYIITLTPDDPFRQAFRLNAYAPSTASSSRLDAIIGVQEWELVEHCPSFAFKHIAQPHRVRVDSSLGYCSGENEWCEEGEKDRCLSVYPQQPLPMLPTNTTNADGDGPMGLGRGNSHCEVVESAQCGGRSMCLYYRVVAEAMDGQGELDAASLYAVAECKEWRRVVKIRVGLSIASDLSRTPNPLQCRPWSTPPTSSTTSDC